jgi:xanthine dehydrogenase accessory factor
LENLDVLVLRQLRDWRLAGKKALLATVVRTWGSSPRPVGSIMALCESGAVVGSVSGGCIEDDLIDRFTKAYAGVANPDVERTIPGMERAIPTGAPQFIKYGISADEAHQFGLPCGGTLELLLEFDPDAALLSELVQALDAGRLMLRTVELATGKVTQLEKNSAPEGQHSTNSPQELAVNAQQLSNTFGPEYRMLLIGAGQLAEYLATMALFNGFAVTVCDPRDEYRSNWSVPQAKLTTEMPDDVVKAFRPDSRSCVVALTHDPKLDDLALLEALESPAFYIGAIGSRRNNALRHARMKEHFEQTDESLARLRGPIGIYIGSKLPSEIAVSIMAEILAVKNGVKLPREMEVSAAKDELEILPNDAESALVCQRLR